MKFNLIYIGKDAKNHYSEAESEYVKRIKKFIPLQVKPLSPPKHSQSLSSQEIKMKEAELFLQKVPSSATMVILDERGEHYDSIKFSNFINRLISRQNKDIYVVIGGAQGLSEDIFNKADHKIALSKFTLPHHLARVVFLEQLYRAFSILHGSSYHNQ